MGIIGFWDGAQWIALDAKNADTLDGQHASSFAASSHNHDASYLGLGGGTLTGALTLSGDPSNALHAATKQYVDSLTAGGAAHAVAALGANGFMSAADKTKLDNFAPPKFSIGTEAPATPTINTIWIDIN